MLVISLTAIHLAIHIPSVQNFIAHKVISKIEPKIDGKIEFSKLTITFVSRVIIEDLAVTGAPGDTLISAEKLAVYVSFSDILHGDIRANRISIKNGVFNYIEEGNKTSNLSRIFKMEKDPNDTTKGGWPFITIRELRIQDYRFKYVGDTPPKSPVKDGCMDYTNIGLSDINLRIHDIKVRPKKGITAKIHTLKAKEKSGLDLQQLSCDFSLDKNLLAMRNLTLRDNYTNLKANHLTFGYDSGKDLKDFINKIKLDVDFTDTEFDFGTVGFFTHSMQGNHLKLSINGRVYGPVAHLQSQSLEVSTPSEDTYIRLKFSMKGLPDIRKTIFDAHIQDLRTRSEDIDHIIASFAPDTKPILGPMIPGADVALHLDMLGTIYDFVTDGRLHTSLGDAAFDLDLEFPGKNLGSIIKGKLSTYDLNLGKIISSPTLGEVSAGVKADIRLRKREFGGLSANIDSLRIAKLGFKGYNYSNIFAIASYSDKKFDGRIIGHDPNLHFQIQGIASLADKEKNSSYKLHADIPFADLAAIKILDTQEKAQLSLRTAANVSLSGENLIGNIDLRNITFWGEEEYQFNSISLSALFKDKDYNIALTAPFLDARYTSTETPSAFISRVKGIVLEEQFGETFTKGKREKATPDLPYKGNTDLSLVTFNTESICDIVMPDLYLADSTRIGLSLNDQDSLHLSIDSERIALNKNFLKDLSLIVENKDSIIHSSITSSSANLASIDLNDTRIGMKIEDGIIGLNCTFDNSRLNQSELSLISDISFDRGTNNKLVTNVAIDTSFVTIKGHKWHFNPSTISISSKNFKFRDFRLQNEDQYISIEGDITDNSTDRVSVTLHEFDLSFADSFLKKKINIEGILTGDITASGIFDTPNILMDVKGRGLALMSRTIGDLQLLSKWDQTNKRMNLLVQNQIEGMNPLTVSGYYQPQGKFVNANISFQEFSLAILEPFLKDVLTNTGGVISGDLELVGTMDRLTLTSENTMLHNFTFTPVFTNVPYVVSGPVGFTRDAISFNNLKVHDKFNNEGTLSGSLRHRSFKNMYLDARLAFNNLQCLNSTDKDNDTFYGSAFASGNINISGPFNDLYADITATTEPNTAIHVPLSSASSAKSEDLLTFSIRDTIKVDPYLEKIQKKNKKIKEGKKSNFSLQAKANVTSDAELYIEINKQLGDILKCRGNGAVDVTLDPARSIFDLKGDYTIDEGSYKFVLLGITAKDFIIDNGGSINFNGDIKSTSLNVGATYQTKASISTLISDTSAVGNRRVVDCGIKMSGSLSNPNISFAIDVQDLDPITKGRVESALSTDDKIQKQFMALLISGSFVPDEQSGIVNNTTILYSNAGEMLSNQFNNVFRQLDIPLDLGLNFQPATDGKTHDMFDVALSYQAFNNRMVINGNVGNNQASQAWGGDFEAEVKLDKKGKMRLKAFTRAADDYSNYLDNTQRHGIGFTYQDEFDNFRELLRNIFWSKKRREEYETKLMLEAEKQIVEEDKANEHKKEIHQAKESIW